MSMTPDQMTEACNTGNVGMTAEVVECASQHSQATRKKVLDTALRRAIKRDATKIAAYVVENGGTSVSLMEVLSRHQYFHGANWSRSSFLTAGISTMARFPSCGPSWGTETGLNGVLLGERELCHHPAPLNMLLPSDIPCSNILHEMATSRHSNFYEPTALPYRRQSYHQL